MRQYKVCVVFVSNSKYGFIMDVGALDELRTDLFLLGTELYNELIVLVFAIETGS